MRFDSVDAALEGAKKFADKAYLFKGNRYTRYNWKTDREEFGYPAPISAWHLPPPFDVGVDAAVNGQGDFTDFAYFFKGGKYARYNWVTDKVEFADRDLSAWKLPASFLSGVDAVLNGEGRFKGTTYFFKRGTYARYHWSKDTCEGPIETASAWKFPDDFNTGIDAAMNGRGDFAGKAYVFKGSRYARYDWSADRPDPGYPHPIQGDWKHGIAIWAGIDTALSVDADARLRENDGSTLSLLPYPKGTTRGQAGWDIGMRFTSPKDLAAKLRHQPIQVPAFVCGNIFEDCGPLGPGQISRLAINAHGGAGEVALWGRHDHRRLTPITLAADADLRKDLEAIRDATEPGAAVLFMGCLAGKSLGGTALLGALSLLMPDRKIVGFSTVGFSHGARQSRHGFGPVTSTEAGMRDTEFFIEAGSEAEEDARYGPIWNDLAALPWAHENSPHAKVALNGVIIRGAEL